jgi:sarcosine dehydrogenase
MAGLGFAVKLRPNVAFKGRDALEAMRDRRPPRLLAGFRIAEPNLLPHGRETIYRDGRRLGWLSSGGFGHSFGVGLGLGYIRDPENGVDRETALSGEFELEVAMERVPAQPFLKPPYDPKMVRVRA